MKDFASYFGTLPKEPSVLLLYCLVEGELRGGAADGRVSQSGRAPGCFGGFIVSRETSVEKPGYFRPGAGPTVGCCIQSNTYCGVSNTPTRFCSLTLVLPCFKMCGMVNKMSSVSGIRFTPEDRKLLQALNKKLGVGLAAIVRLGLRALATKEGVKGEN